MAKEGKKDKKNEKKGTEVAVKSGGKVAKQAATASSRDLVQDFERAIENFFDRSRLRHSLWDFPEIRPFSAEQAPKVNVIDRENEVAIEAELPGVSKDDIDVSLSDNLLTIKASTRKETSEEKGDYHRHEISTGQYIRTLPLPAAVDRDNVRTEFKDGLLTLTLPKTEKSKRQSIKVE